MEKAITQIRDKTPEEKIWKLLWLMKTLIGKKKTRWSFMLNIIIYTFVHIAMIGFTLYFVKELFDG